MHKSALLYRRKFSLNIQVAVESNYWIFFGSARPKLAWWGPVIFVQKNKKIIIIIEQRSQVNKIAFR